MQENIEYFLGQPAPANPLFFNDVLEAARTISQYWPYKDRTKSEVALTLSGIYKGSNDNTELHLLAMTAALTATSVNSSERTAVLKAQEYLQFHVANSALENYQD